MGRRKPKQWRPKNRNKIPFQLTVAMGRRKPKQWRPKNRNKTPPLPPPPWIELPRDVTANILQRLGADWILKSARGVCTTWSKVCQDPAMWRVVSLSNPARFDEHDDFEEFEEAYDIMCRRAVDWSQGLLVDLTLEYFGEGDLINYIANRSSNLKRLTLRCCSELDGFYLAEAVKKLPELEELHLTNMPSVSAANVKTIGLSCPKLKSFSYNGRGFKRPRRRACMDADVEDHQYQYALAIGTSMPNLRHLRLFALPLLNERLEAILDACPHLESLDLRQCYDLDLGEDLDKRCREQIKDLRLPYDSTSDIQQLVGGPSDWDDASDDDIGDFNYYDVFGRYDHYDDDYEEYDDYCNPFAREYIGDDAFFFDDHDYL